MSTVGAVCAGVASVIGAVVVGLLVVGLVEGYRPATSPSPEPGDDPEETGRWPVEWAHQAVAEKLRRREAAARVAADFPVGATAPYIASGRAGRVDRQRVTVALVKGGPR